MKKVFVRIVERLFLRKNYVLIERKDLPLHNILNNDYGHKNSVLKQAAIDSYGNPIPWYTYPAIEYLKQIDMQHYDVFEWGSGNSSLFFSERCHSVISIESNPEWFEYVSKNKSANQTVIFSEKADYVEKIKSFNKKFDIIIIDDILRYQCAQIAQNYLNVGGIIILDNSDWFKKTAVKIASENLIQIDFHGFGPINNYCWTTTIFLSKNCNIQYLNNNQLSNPIGGIHINEDFSEI
jgi:hypothetical protein